ncbi:MAG: YgaP-like transmembrane domain [Dehalococcoidia bacterium]
MNTTTTSVPEGSAFSRFMASCNGRVARTVLGTAIIATGLGLVGGATGIAIAAAGLVPIAAGAFNLCPIAPAWGGHFLGSSYCAVRERDTKRE